MQKLSELTKNPQNPRRISEKKREMLRKSVEQLGCLDGVVWNRRLQRLIGGHQRQDLDAEALVHVERQFDPPTPEGTVAEGFVMIKGIRFPYREVDFDEPTDKLANIAANKGAGEWDFPQLREWMLDLDALNVDMELTMFDDEERENLVVPIFHVPPEGDPDHIPEAPREPTVRRGDVWQLGRHRLMCGDSTIVSDVERLMGGELADLVFTDPPYGVDYDGGHAVKGKRREKLANDDSVDIYGDSVPMMAAFSKEEAALYLWFACTKADTVLQVLQANNYETRSWLIWNKNMAQFGAIGAQYKQKHEPCLYAYKKGNAPFWSGPNNEVSVWDISRASKNEFHPTQKPAELSERAMRNSCPPNGLVLDLFGGSGSTLIGAEMSSRHACVMELSESYCSVIKARWEKLTGQTAELMAP